jgi:hypothetical protein
MLTADVAAATNRQPASVRLISCRMAGKASQLESISSLPFERPSACAAHRQCACELRDLAPELSVTFQQPFWEHAGPHSKKNRSRPRESEPELAGQFLNRFG